MIFIGIGSNLSSGLFGSPFNNCIAAIEELKKHFEIKNISQWYESEPIPKSDQPWFINGVISILTNNKPLEVLDILLKVENSLGRKRYKKNEARIIDLDLLSYNDLVLHSEKLILPHPRMHLRSFVLKPIEDINSKWVHPFLKINVKNLLDKIKDSQDCKNLK